MASMAPLFACCAKAGFIRPASELIKSLCECSRYSQSLLDDEPVCDYMYLSD